MIKKKTAIIVCAAMMMFAAACGRGAERAEGRIEKENESGRYISAGLQYDHSMELKYAQEFAVDYYQDGYALITVSDGARFLVIPEGGEAPEDLPGDVVLLKKPLENVYLVASASMDMFASLDALDAVRFSGLKAESWYIPKAREAMERGDILYAGRYAAPDYEKILAEKCGLAIENTMIYHSPEVKEQLERLGIPVLVDHSSYERHPLGRTEWVKLYGLLTGKEAEAEAAFDEQSKALETVQAAEKSEKTVAFFYFTAGGGVNVRRSSDYLPKMIELAGGSYIFDHLGDGDDTVSSTVSLQMEEFYTAARDADYVIYNSTIEGEQDSLEALLEQSPMLEKFRAVREGHVFCTTSNLYQSSMELGTMISDLHRMMAGEEDGFSYIYKLK